MIRKALDTRRMKDIWVYYRHSAGI